MNPMTNSIAESGSIDDEARASSPELVGKTGLRAIQPEPSQQSILSVEALRDSATRRAHIPLRITFVATDADEPPPLARLVSTQGRGGAVAVKLYLALVWRCSAPPFGTQISARKWAILLDLDDPGTRGARRVNAALRRLADMKLIELAERRGEASQIVLLDESASGSAYTLPSTEYVKAGRQHADRYFRVPLTLWSSGHMQDMSAAAVAMLLATLEATRQPHTSVWWSTTRFPKRYSISPAMRARGTRELVQRRLLLVTKQLVDQTSSKRFSNDRVRNTYLLINEAVPLWSVPKQG